MQLRFRAFAATFVLAAPVSAQSVLFDFNDAPLHSPLPIDLTVGGITAHFSATGQGFSIQDMSAPVAPVGFSGRFIYPSSVFPADLLVAFDRPITDFSILYAPDELACDDSATMRVTATLNGSFVGTNTKTTSHPGTYPVDTLACSFPQGFDAVVVHYDSHPPTCQDYGVIFLCDDMRVTAAVPPISSFCFGDGSVAACPCSNGAAGNGCGNSAHPEGSNMSGSGVASLAADTLTFAVVGHRPSTLAVVMQGDAQVGPLLYGDGLRCTGGTLKRLFKITPATDAVLTAPSPTSIPPSPMTVSARSAALMDPLSAGSIRYYDVFYRDSAIYCTPATFNVSNAVRVLWSP